MPFQLFEKLTRVDKIFEGLNAVKNIAMSVLDQRLHGPWEGAIDRTAIKAITRDTFNEFCIGHETKSGVVPFPAALSHFGSYGSNYYSYTCKNTSTSNMAEAVSQSATLTHSRRPVPTGDPRSWLLERLSQRDRGPAWVFS
jgi:Zn-dependent oligopeptidase